MGFQGSVSNDSNSRKDESARRLEALPVAKAGTRHDSHGAWGVVLAAMV